MRIVVSGTHASGKSTLLADFCTAHPEYVALGDPFDDLDEAELPSEASFARQLRVSAVRLREHADAVGLIAERGPLDFLAYLTAWDELGRSDGSLLTHAEEIVEESLADVDLIVVVPLDPRHPIDVPDDEEPELRDAMNEALVDLADDLERAFPAVRFETLAGDRDERLARLLALTRPILST